MTRSPLEFGAAVARAEDGTGWDEAIVREVEGRLFAAPFTRRTGTRGRTTRRLVLAAAFAAGFCLSVVVVFFALSPTPLGLFVDGENVARPAGFFVEARDDEHRRLLFSDGSRVVLAPSTGARVIDTTPKGARVLVERGSIRVEVVHLDDTDWQFDIGPFSIRVTGTVFDVAWRPDDGYFSVTMEEGSVEVEGPTLAAARTVTAGETLRAWTRTRKVVQISNGHGDDTAAPPSQTGPKIGRSRRSPNEAHGDATEEPIAEPASRPADTVVSNSSVEGGDRTWRSSPRAVGTAGGAPPSSPKSRPSPTGHPSPPPVLGPAVTRPEPESLVEAGDIVTDPRADEEGALEAAPELINTRIAPLSPEEAGPAPAALLQQGDRARLDRDFATAKQTYLTVRRRFGGTPSAAMAAFALGRITFDHEKNYAAAAKWFRTFLSEHRGQALRREALGRLMESLHKAGDLNGSARAARQYLERYADGPHAALARSIVDDRTDSR